MRHGAARVETQLYAQLAHHAERYRVMITARSAQVLAETP